MGEGGQVEAGGDEYGAVGGQGGVEQFEGLGWGHGGQAAAVEAGLVGSPSWAVMALGCSQSPQASDRWAARRRVGGWPVRRGMCWLLRSWLVRVRRCRVPTRKNRTRAVSSRWRSVCGGARRRRIRAQHGVDAVAVSESMHGVSRTPAVWMTARSW